MLIGCKGHRRLPSVGVGEVVKWSRNAVGDGFVGKWIRNVDVLGCLVLRKVRDGSGNLSRMCCRRVVLGFASCFGSVMIYALWKCRDGRQETHLGLQHVDTRASQVRYPSVSFLLGSH